jgi:hypothetical protein
LAESVHAVKQDTILISRMESQGIRRGGGSLNICCTIYRPTVFFPSNIFFLCRKNERKKERAEKRGNEGERREKKGEKDDT